MEKDEFLQEAEALNKLVSSGDILGARERVMNMNPVDIAELYEELKPENFVILFRVLPKDTASDVFAYLDSDDRETMVKMISDLELVDIINRLEIDDLVDIVDEMPANVVKKILKNTSQDTRKEINKLLSYPENSAGSIMNTRYLSLKEDWNIKKCINYIRENGEDRETINILYVTDSGRKLSGIIEIRDIILNEPDEKVHDVMDKNFIRVHTLDDQEDVAAQFKKYGLIAMPVVDNEERLVGMITVDDVLHIIEEENEEDFEIMHGLSPSEEEYLKSGAFLLAKKRIGWLVFLMLSATFTSIIINNYEHLLSEVLVLASFIPMLTDTGGNAGSQSSTLVIRGIALGEIEPSDVFKIILKEINISLMVGVVLGVINVLRLYFLSGQSISVALTVGISVVCIIIIAQITGAVLPLVAKSLNFDPALMATPMITTIVDVLSLLIYFNVAKVFVIGG